MRPVVTADEYRRVDSEYQGDMALAMDRAGHAVALAAVRAGAGYGTRVVVLAGPGNNGGDGYVSARLLRSRGAYVEVHALESPRSDLAESARDKAEKAGVVVRSLDEVVSADLVVDALFGGASRPGLPDQVLAWMDTNAPVVAVDFPTGLDPDTGAVAQRSFVAVETVTFGCLKTGHVRDQGPDHCGVVTVADIGISGGRPSMYIAEEDDAPRPARQRRAHKWSAGSVLVLGGSSGLVGAAILAGRSALAFGAGSVYVASPRPELMQVTAPELPALSIDNAAEQLDRFDVVVAGPGLSPGDVSMTTALLAKADRVVLDAGGLTAEALSAAREGGAAVIITPHDAEFARIAGVGAGTFSVRSFAGRRGIVVLRKGNPTMISDGGVPVLVVTGGPELASIGTGDVLAGMVGALWARGLSPMEAATSGAYWHGVAGADLSADRSVTADVLVDRIGVHAW
jgi:ADP-dependent NAD(P)H-hydrate dehydratase / NAD(P)H-hydrate epimerase